MAGGWRGSCPLCPYPWAAGGVRISLHFERFLPLLPSVGAFSDIVDSLDEENFSRGKRPDSQITMVLLGDQNTKHCSSGKEFEDQNLSPVKEHTHT